MQFTPRFASDSNFDPAKRGRNSSVDLTHFFTTQHISHIHPQKKISIPWPWMNSDTTLNILLLPSLPSALCKKSATPSVSSNNDQVLITLQLESFWVRPKESKSLLFVLNRNYTRLSHPIIRNLLFMTDKKYTHCKTWRIMLFTACPR